MAYLSFWKRNRVPGYLDRAEITTGKIEFDPALCTNCGICEETCPIGTIVVPETGLPYVHEAGPDMYMCFGCGNCASVCPYDAVKLTRPYTTHSMYNRLTRAPVLTAPKKY
jgi:heterodisulfide reductase subunit A-like polyferredoxin